MQKTHSVCRGVLGVAVMAAILAWTTDVSAGESASVQALKSKAIAGDVDAQLSLARAYDFGNGVRSSKGEAARWYEAAANQGNASAQNSIGSLYLDGEGVSKNPVKACEWFGKSAAQDDVQGTGNWAYCFDFGIGVTQDRAKGAALYERAASAGDLQSMLNIGVDYWKGVGVERDLTKGYMWLDLVRFYSQTGNANRTLKWRARGALDAMTKEISSDIKAQGEAMSRDWDKANRGKVQQSPAY